MTTSANGPAQNSPSTPDRAVPPRLDRVAFVASEAADARAARQRLIHRYGNAPAYDCDVIIALGGDGFMLETLHAHMHDKVPIYGMNRGSVGFLMNEYREDELVERLAKAERARVRPLAMSATTIDGEEHKGLAINEVSMFRQTYQAAKLRISVDGTVRMEEMICDGVLIATPAGSTAYNLSAHGPILPIDAKLMALTPICPFRPRRWRGALLPWEAKITIEVLDPLKRPVSAVADNAETRSVVRVDVAQAQGVELNMLFDRGHSLDERVLSEQFRY